jgi:ATP-dependent Clp protease ATP-binding subunit ClpX
MDSRMSIRMAVRHCSFCGKSDADVLVVIEGPDRVRICDECVDLCAEIVEDHRSGKAQQDMERIREHLGWPKPPESTT